MPNKAQNISRNMARGGKANIVYNICSAKRAKKAIVEKTNNYPTN